MKVGASYYPELLPETEWERDLTSARELGMSVLRCGEFAWSRLSPTPQEWHLDWAVRFLQLAGRLGFDVIWCTPTATPPPYLFQRWPDLNAVSSRGRQLPVGVRRNYCPSHAGYRALAVQTASKLAEAFAGEPIIKGWQVDNELAGDEFTCWCDRCLDGFRADLQRRYDTIESLNQAWQTDVWSQRYTAWEQIPMPASPAASHSPCLRLAYRRFMSGTWLEFYREQAAALRAGGASRVTTNWFDFAWDMPFDRWQWRGDLDAVGLSQYVDEEIESRFTLAAARGIARGVGPLWIMEQSAGSLRAENTLDDDAARLQTHLGRCAEAGAEYAIYWHLRQHSSGAEAEHGGVLRYDGEKTRVSVAVSRAIAASASAVEIRPATDVVLQFSYQQQWAKEHRPRTSTPYDYRKRVEQDWYAGARDALGEVAIGCCLDPHEGCTLMIAPLLQMEEPGLLDCIDACLLGGGTVITTADFCRLDNDNNIQRRPPLAALARWVAAVPKLQILQLGESTRVVGQFDQTDVSGSIFWAIAEESAPLNDIPEPLGELKFNGHHGPIAIRLLAGAGSIIVVLTEPDRAGVAALVRFAHRRVTAKHTAARA